MLSETTQSTRIKVKSTTRQITGGPSREELFDALRLHTHERPHTVTFTVGGARKVEVVITSLEREDGSGHIWNFRGNLWCNQMTALRGSYSTRHRTQGAIEFTL